MDHPKVALFLETGLTGHFRWPCLINMWPLFGTIVALPRRGQFQETQTNTRTETNN